MKIQLLSYQIPLAHVFRLARSERSSQDVLIVKLSHNGIDGLGEAVDSSFYNAYIPDLIKDILSFKPYLEKMTVIHPEEFWKSVAHLPKIHSFAQNAIDQALWDLYGKTMQKPLWQMWGLNNQKIPLTSYTIGIDTAEKMVEKLKEYWDWPVFKIKLGRGNDIDLVKALRQTTSALFRVDANCGWKPEQLPELSDQLSKLNVEFIEQPMSQADSLAHPELKNQSALPLIADESCERLEDIERCAASFHGINIKLVKCGGITPALAMIKKAQSLGLKLMMGCMVESSVGISAISQFLPYLDYVDMDGALLLKEDIADGAKIVLGKPELSQKFGTGVDLINASHLLQKTYE